MTPAGAALLAERGEHRGDDAAASRPAFAYMACGLFCSMKTIRQMQRAHFQPAVEQAFAGESLQHHRAEAAARTFLDGDQHLVVAARAGAANPCRAAWRSARRRRWSGRPKPASWSAAARHSGSLAPKESSATAEPSRKTRPLPISSGVPALGQSDADALPARIAKGGGTIVDAGGRRHHMHQLGLVGCRHHHHAGQARRDRRHRKTPAWVGPSAPTSPARSMAKRTGRPCTATSCTTWS